MTQSGGFVILNVVKNPYLSHTATVKVKNPQNWILRLAFGKSQNDTRKCSTLPQFPLCVILNEVKNPFSSHTRTVEVEQSTGLDSSWRFPHHSE
jgi:hypothetical protein